MPYEIQQEPGERVLLDLAFRASEKQVVYRSADRPDDLRLGISDRAIYLPAKRFVVSGDPCYFRRVPKAQVNLVQVQGPRAYGLWIAAVLMVLAGVCASLVNGTFAVLLTGLFPTRVRFSGVALGFNIAFTIFSGTAPLIATSLIRSTGMSAAPAFVMIVCGSLTLAAAQLSTLKSQLSAT